MPIRINLLAEAQAAEDLRRRDPVKRVLWIGACLVAAILAWASTLQARIVLRSTQLDSLEGKIKDLEGEYGGVVASQKALASARQNLNALERLRTNRFLTGNLLDTLQKVYVEDVRVVKLKTEFAYQKTAATPAKTNAFTVTPGTPETATERIKVQIEAIDASGTAGDNVNAYKEAATALASIDSSLDGQESEIRLTGLNPPQTDPSGRQFVLFTLECPYPEKVR